MLSILVCVFADFLKFEDIEGWSMDHFLGSLVNLKHRDHVLYLDLELALFDFLLVVL